MLAHHPYSRKRERRTCLEAVRSLQRSLWGRQVEAVTNLTGTKSQIQVSGKSVRGFGFLMLLEWGAESLWSTRFSADRQTIPQKTACVAPGEISSSFTGNLTQTVNALWHRTRMDRVGFSVRIWHSVSLRNTALGRQSWVKFSLIDPASLVWIQGETACSNGVALS